MFMHDIQNKQIWYLDSGCSGHMTGCKSLLLHYKEKDGPAVTFGDNSKGYTKGSGTLRNGNVNLTNVAYVVRLKHNLISIS